MRDFKGMKRQRGRNNRGGGNTGGKPQQHNANRAFDSNGPEGVKVRGAAQGVYEKYQQLARDASSSGDRVLAENYLQHAEHYFRVLRAIQPNRPVSDIIGKDAYSAYEIDFEAEPEEAPEVVEAPAAENNDDGDGQRDDRPRDQNRDRFENRPREDRQNRDDRPRDQNRDGQNRDRFDNNQGQGQGQGRRDRWRDRDDRPRDGQNQNRDDRPRDDRPRDDRPRDDRPRDDRPREDRPRDDRPPREDRFRDDRPRDDRPREERAPREERFRDRDDRPRDDRPREDRPAAAVEVPAEAPVAAEGRRERAPRRAPRERDPLAVIEPQATPLTSDAGEGSPMLRGQDGAVSHAPAFLGRSAAAEAPAEGEEVKKPRRRRAPRSFEGGEGAPPAPESEDA